MSDVGAKRREERVKLFASALSNLGVAVIVAGVIAPALSGRVETIAAILAFVAGFGLHLAAQGVLHYVVTEAQPIAPPEPEVQS